MDTWALPEGTEEVVRVLRDTYTKTGIQIWLSSRNRNLGEARPIDLLCTGSKDEVLAEARRVAGS